MSTIGTITVNKCDGCAAVAVLHTDADYASFETNWYDGTWTHFCPDCRHLSRHQAAIQYDQALRSEIAEVARSVVENSPALEETISTGGQDARSPIYDGH